MVLISLIMISMLCLTGASVWAEDTYEVDPIHSSVVFKVGHLNIGTVFGMFTDFSGTIIADRENPEKSSVEMTVRAASVNTHVDKRDDHLRSNEFFNAALFPEIKFKSTGVKKIDDKTFEVTGNFNLHGITKELTVTVHFLGEGNDPWGGYRMGFETEFDIVRSEFGMTQHIPAAGDKARVILAVEAVKK
jgi:polyisoprenoid-binding protein YceI